jgi:hypothetical protein
MLNIPSTHARWLFWFLLVLLIVLLLIFGSLLSLAAGIPFWAGVLGLALPLLTAFIAMRI